MQFKLNFFNLNLLLYIAILQLTLFLAVSLDLPLVRQVTGFIYFNFLPGLIIVKLLKLNERLETSELILFSLGISISLLMLLGLLTNGLAPSFGVDYPLSTLPLLIIFSSFIILGGIIASLRSDAPKLKISFSPSVLPITGLLFFSVAGAMTVNVYGSNILLLLMLVITALTFVIGLIGKNAPSNFYSTATFIIALSLLWHASLISNYIVGFNSDVARELYIFKNTLNKAYWDPVNPYFGNLQNGRIHAMLSVTILSTIYSTLLNLEATWIFKVIFPLIFSLVPLVLYRLYVGLFGEKKAFASVFLFMSYETFYTEMLGLSRQIIGELFFALLLFTILTKKLNGASQILCFILFSFGLVTSHYGLAEILSFLILFTFLPLFILRHERKGISLSMIILFFVLMFSWYVYTANQAVFQSILEYGEYVRDQLQDFLNPASRGTEVMRGLGLESPPTIWNMISRAFAYITEFLIVVGFLDLIFIKRKMLAKDYVALNIIAMALLSALIVVPGLANTMNMTRFYHVLLFILSPLCVNGAEFICHRTPKNKEEKCSCLLLLIVLIPYFLFQTSFVYEVVGSKSWSLPLSKHRMSSFELRTMFGYFNDANVYCAQWLSKSMDFKDVKVYADILSRSGELFCYGMLNKEDILVLSNVTQFDNKSTIYLNDLNVIDGRIIGSRYIWNTTDFSILNDASRIYTNGANEIYYKQQ